MEYTKEHRVSQRLLYEVQHITDEYLYRELIETMVRSLPLSELQKVFNTEKIDPSSYEARTKMRDYHTPPHVKHKIQNLESVGEILYTVKLNIK